MIFFSYLGGGGGVLGGLTSTQGYQIFRVVRPHHRVDKCITREQNSNQFFIYGPQCEKCAFLSIRGVGEGGGGLCDP